MRQLANLSFKKGRGCPFPGWRVYYYIPAITAWANLVTGIQDPSVLFRTKKIVGGLHLVWLTMLTMCIILGDTGGFFVVFKIYFF